VRVFATAAPGHTVPYAALEGVEKDEQRNLIGSFLADSDGSEDLVLAALDRAEGGTPVFSWSGNYTYTDMFPDGRVIIHQADYLVDEDGDSEHPPQTTITISEARQLLLEWLKAKEAWYAELRKKEEEEKKRREEAAGRGG